MIIPVTDPDDPRIAPYHAIRERDLVQRDGLFIAEGKTVLQVLVEQAQTPRPRFALQSLFILENRMAGLAALLADRPQGLPVYVADRTVMDAVAGFPMHRGVLALAARPADADAAPEPDQARAWRRVVAVSQLANHDNMGAIFRNAAAFGTDAVLMDKGSCDPLYRKAIRVSVGGVFKVPFHVFEDTATMLDFLDDGGFETVALSPSAQTRLDGWTPNERTALLLGAEGPGLDPAVMAARATLRIAMAPGFDSLNVATAAAIALHHLHVSGN